MQMYKEHQVPAHVDLIMRAFRAEIKGRTDGVQNARALLIYLAAHSGIRANVHRLQVCQIGPAGCVTHVEDEP